jgi:hypothetical protein
VGTIVDRNGLVVAIAYTGEHLGDQWPGSRIISAQKANAANGLRTRQAVEPCHHPSLADTLPAVAKAVGTKG